MWAVPNFGSCSQSVSSLLSLYLVLVLVPGVAGESLSGRGKKGTACKGPWGHSVRFPSPGALPRRSQQIS